MSAPSPAPGTTGRGGPLVVHQLLPNLSPGDAAGHHALQVRDVLRRAGFESELFCTTIASELAGEAHPVAELPAYCRRGRTALLYQFAIGSVLADIILERPEPVIVNYHNLTPGSFFWQWDPGQLEGILWGQRQLHQLVHRTVHAIGVSAFNTRDLEHAGYVSTATVPPLLDVASFDGAADATALARWGGPARRDAPAVERGARWLFVGRLAPNKAAHDLVKALAAYRRAYDPDARLLLVGGHGIPSYADAVRRLVGALGLDAAVELVGSVTHAELAAAYAAADVFVCLSDHEGFCFPLVEAMYHGVPVVGYDAGAVGDTIGSGGVVLRSKSPATVAAAVSRVVQVPGRRQALAAAGRDRVSAFSLDRTAPRMVAEVRQGLRNAGLLPGRPSWAGAAP